MSDLNKVKLGMSWGGASTVVVAGFQIVFMAILARLIEPAAFGLVALSGLGLRFLSYFAQLGIGPAIIQREKLDDKDIVAALYVSVSVAAFFSIIAICLAPYFSNYFAMPKLTPVLQVLALNFVISGFSVVAQSLLRRNMRFKAISVIDVISYTVSYGVIGVSAAYMGLGVWALVAAVSSQLLLNALLSYYLVCHPIVGKIDMPRCKELFLYGGKYSLIGFVEFFSLTVDALIVGKLHGDVVAGQYTRGQIISQLPIQNIVNLYTKIIFPIMSRKAEEQGNIANYFVLSILAIGLYAFPIGIYMHIYASDIIAILLGKGWGQAAEVMSLFCLVVGFTFLNQICGMTLDVLGEVNIKLKIQTSAFALLLLLMSILYPIFSISGLIFSMLIVEFTRFCVFSFLMIIRLKIKWREYMKILIFIALVVVTSVAPIYLLKIYCLVEFLPIFRLLISGIVFVFIYACAIFIYSTIVNKIECIIVFCQRVPFLARLV
ncbi:MAG: lipopolysaccharide biosynthesis protein [Proteobacteria bacterium]|nr:lipopolysaccharide biosynthesis protein [Pseudomonadota bacterium]